MPVVVCPSDCFDKHSRLVVLLCRIQRYSVIPLSTNSGLIGWVPNCDTLHSLIRDYREKKKILLNLEHRIMLRVWLIRCGSEYLLLWPLVGVVVVVTFFNHNFVNCKATLILAIKFTK